MASTSEDNKHRLPQATADVGGGMQLYKRLRREYEHGIGTIRGVANKYKVHRRTVRAALKNAVPPKRKAAHRERPKMALAIPFIDAILENDLKVTFNQRHTAHQIWEQLQVEMPACDVGESTIRAYVRGRKTELYVVGQVSSQTAAAWMLEVLHSDAPLRVIEREFPSDPASDLVGLIKGGRLRDRKKALAVLGSLKGIGTAAIAQCLQISRKTVAAILTALRAAASMPCYRPRRASRKMIESASNSCFGCFTLLRRLTGLIAHPGG
jgi:hypothetical protein